MNEVGTIVAPAISVLMAVQHAGRFLEPALHSLANQTFQDYELIIVDNNSRDGTDHIMAEWAERDVRVRRYRQNVLGAAKCINFAASVAQAPLLARLDGTDVMHPDRLRIQYDRMKQEPNLGLLGGRVELIDVDDVVIGRRDLPLTDQELRAFLRRGNPFVQSTVMMRRSVFEAVGGYRISLRTSNDFDLWCRMADVAQIANMQDVLARFRIIEGGIPPSRPIRMALTDTCIIAAARARENGKPEPFVDGRANLRAALRILGRSREEFRYRVLKDVVGMTRRALACGDVAFAGRLRARALHLARGLSLRQAPRSLACIVASYFPAGSRQRRRSTLRRFLPIAEGPAG
jgi:glycosyltransferase involved in cell wall biosynthesis